MTHNQNVLKSMKRIEFRPITLYEVHATVKQNGATISVDISINGIDGYHNVVATEQQGKDAIHAFFARLFFNGG